MEGPLPGFLTHMAGTLVLAVNEELQFLAKGSSPWNYSSVLTTWQLLSPEQVI